MFLAKQFKENKQFGSSDRRFYKQACYAFWRFTEDSSIITETTVQNCLLKQNPDSKELLDYASENGISVNENNSSIYASKFSSLVSPNISLSDLNLWFQKEAPVYLLPYPGKASQVEAELARLQLDFVKEDAFFKTNKSPFIQTLLDSGLCRIQDRASANSLLNLPIQKSDYVWDCCCGAGGKSLTIAQYYPTVNLFCSDSRSNILSNLKQRFHSSGLTLPKTGVINLSESAANTADMYDVIVADVPCSGSGTWRHNPEQAHFFDPNQLDKITALQRRICTNAIQNLKPGGTFVYITCSVFTRENEENTEWISQNLGLQWIGSAYSEGASQDEDYLFKATFKKG